MSATITRHTRRRRLTTIADAAQVWGVCTRTIRRRVADGTLTAYRLPGGGSIRVDLEELDAVLRPIPSGGAA